MNYGEQGYVSVDRNSLLCYKQRENYSRWSQFKKNAVMSNKIYKAGGRPSKSRVEKQHRVVSTKLTEFQYYAIRKRASEAGILLSDYIRQAILSGEIVSRLNKQDANVIRQLAGEANNINQLTHKANVGGFVSVERELMNLKVKIVGIIDQLSDDWKNSQRKRF